MNILGISGSLRKASYNRLLLKTAGMLLDNHASLTLFDLDDIPLYNAELDGTDKPEPVQKLLNAISASDGLLFATPEYNYSIPGVLKNAIDWASRPAFKSVLANKPAAIISASQSAAGGVRAQVHLRDVLSSTLTPVYRAPDYFLPLAQSAFANTGELIDDTARERLKRYLDGYVEWLNKN